MQVHTTDLYLSQITLFDRKTPHDSMFWSLLRIEALSVGLTAARHLLQFYLALPLRSETVFNNAQWVQIRFCVTQAAKLSVAASDPSIDQQVAKLRDSLDMCMMLQQVILRVQALVTPLVDARGKRDVFYHYENRLKRLQWWYKTQITQIPVQHQHHASQQQWHIPLFPRRGRLQFRQRICKPTGLVCCWIQQLMIYPTSGIPTYAIILALSKIWMP